MGRLSVQHKALTETRVFGYLLERDDTTKKLKVVDSLLDSILRTKASNGTRRKKYIEQLKNSFKVLCRDSTDLQEHKKKLNDARASTERQSRKRAELADQNIQLQRQNREMSFLESTLAKERASKLHLEQGFGELLTEKRKIEAELRALTIKLKTREAEILELKKNEE